MGPVRGGASGNGLLWIRAQDGAGCLEPVLDLVARVRLRPRRDNDEPARGAGRSGRVGPDANGAQVVALGREVVAAGRDDLLGEVVSGGPAVPVACPGSREGRRGCLCSADAQHHVAAAVARIGAVAQRRRSSTVAIGLADRFGGQRERERRNDGDQQRRGNETAYVQENLPRQRDRTARSLIREDDAADRVIPPTRRRAVSHRRQQRGVGPACWAIRSSPYAQVVRRLSEGDASVMLAFVSELRELEEPLPFPPRLLAGLGQLIPTDQVAYSELDPARRASLLQVWHGADGEDRVSWEAGGGRWELWWRLRDTHPLCGYRAASGDWTTARKVSDFKRPGD